MKRVLNSVFALSIIALASCSNDDGSSTEPDGNIEEIVAPATYTFLREGETTVSFSGQTTRIAMGEEILDAIKDNTLTEETISNMFAHEEGANDFSDADLNASDKSVRSKTAASEDFFSANTTDASAIKAEFDSWITEQVSDVFPSYDVVASAGVAGGIQEAGGGSTRYVNGKGVELNQIFNKGLIGALMTDQIVNNYLSTAVLDEATNVEDNDADTVSEGKNYTNMEHKWDEAYGYLYGAEADPAVPVLNIDSFLNKYLSRVEGDPDFAGIAEEIYNAFKLGRAAIVAKNYEVRDAQAEIIKERISEVIAIRAVYYLQQGKILLEEDATDYASAFHDLSEGLGFVYSLQFTRQPNSSESYFTKSEVDGYLSDLLDEGNGLWEDTTATTLETISNEIADKFDFTVAQAASTN